MQNLIENPSFEDYGAQYCSFKQTVCDLNNTNAIYPWTTNHTFEIVQSPAFAYGGSYSISLNTDSPYGISQTVNLTQGLQYVLTFMLTNGGSTPVTGYINVSNQIGYFSWTDEMYQWKKVYFTFIPQSSLQTVSLVSTTIGSTGPVIDNIVLLLAPNMTSPIITASNNSVTLAIWVTITGIFAFCFCGSLIYYIWNSTIKNTRRSIDVAQEIEMEDVVDDCATLNEEPLIVQVSPSNQ
ncbi:hypothetical protein HDV04_005892 [Boothiomyces sp. JEL0838]|nr:hypothetical protein HDV04_005892 [Boothiomyces sp. JEL0838]